MNLQKPRDRFRMAVVSLFILFAAAVPAAGVWYYRSVAADVEQRGYDQLKAIARLKTDQIVEWRRDAQSMAGILAHSPFFAAAVRRFQQFPQDQDLKGQVLERLRVVKEATGYEEIFIVDELGRTLLSAENPPATLDKDQGKYVAEALSSGRVVTGNLHRCLVCGGLHMEVFAPLSGQGKLPGTVLVYRLDPAHRLFPLLANWPVFRKSAETLLVCRDGDSVVFLNDLRFASDPALSLRVPLSATDVPAVQAVLGREGFFKGRDYRHKEVVSDIHRVPDSDWYMIAKVDESELTSEARTRAGSILVVVLLLVLLAGALSAFVFLSHQKQLYRDLYRSELEKKKLAGYLEMVARYAKDIVLVADQDLKIVEANEAACRAYQYGIEELRNLSVFDLRAPETKGSLQGQVSDLIRKGGGLYETLHQRKDGSQFPVELAVKTIEVEGNRYLYAIGRDLTERKALEEKLREASKMEAVGRLAGGVAHDFNNMLAVIIGYTEMAMSQVGETSPLHQDLEEILKAAQRSAGLTMQLLAFARRQPLSPKVLSLNEVVSGSTGMLRGMAGDNVSLTFKPGDELWRVKMDLSQVNQLLTNLVTNARESIERTGAVEISTGNVTLDPEAAAREGFPGPGDYVRLTVADTGRGIPQDRLPHIFEPFFTTKEVGQGSGLGLASVYGIVTQSPGAIRVESEPEKGSLFHIFLPRTKEEPPKKALPSAPARSVKGVTVLLVEDEVQVLAMAESFLTASGYRVLSAPSGEKALELARGHQGAIDILITDVVMSGMNGKELAEKLSAARPGVRIIFMSGYTRNVVAENGILAKDVHFLQKPFAMSELLSVLQDVLGK
ncbi:MAG: ATP-binding protein [Thermodesulfobacteriota bacterium]